MIVDKNKRQVIHLGGIRDEYGNRFEPDYLVKLIGFLVDAVNSNSALDPLIPVCDLLDAAEEVLNFQPEYSESCAGFGRAKRLKAAIANVREAIKK